MTQLCLGIQKMYSKTSVAKLLKQSSLLRCLF